MRLAGREVDLRRPQLVGILNVTPDSFSDGGQLPDLPAVLARARQMVADGADLLDIGGESTRPGAAEVSEAEELARVLPAVAAISAELPIAVAVDTRRAVVARAALQAGATMINDVSGFSDLAMGEVLAESGAAWVLMHMPHAVGAMQWSQRLADWPDDVEAAIDRIAEELQDAVERALAAGVERAQLAIDPGIGFGKTVAQNLALLRPQPALAKLRLPLYLGPSRKSFLKAVARPGTAEAPRDREFATAAAVAAAVWSGAAFIRVHDVAAMRQVIDTALALRPMG